MLPLVMSRGVTVKGRLTGAWGPMPNHFAEPVLGAVLVVGQQHITVEESEPGRFLNSMNTWNKRLCSLMHFRVCGETNLACMWIPARRSIALMRQRTEPSGVDSSRIVATRANVKGHVIGIRRRSGTRIDGKPWSMLTLMLWDGHHVAEVVAFGASISQRLLSLRPAMAWR